MFMIESFAGCYLIPLRGFDQLLTYNIVCKVNTPIFLYAGFASFRVSTVLSGAEFEKEQVIGSRPGTSN